MRTGEGTLLGAEAYLLGGPGEGFRQMTDMLNLSRLYNAAASVPCMRRPVVEAIGWPRERVAFGRHIVQHLLMTETLLDMASEQWAALRWAFRGITLAALLCQVSLCCSRTLGAGSAWDVRAARRLLARHAPASLLPTERGSVEGLDGVIHAV